MPQKRKAPMPYSSHKRPRLSYEEDDDDDSSIKPYEKPQNHPLYGQKNAFPGLDDGGDELCYGDEDGDADDGLEYLRMVRSEASALPSLFSATKSKLNTDTPSAPIPIVPETKTAAFPPGFFDNEEAYIAPMKTQQNTVAPLHTYPEAQAAYNNLLRHRFLLLRSTLKCSPPATAIAALDDAHPISLPRKVEAARKEWRRLVMSVDPQMVQLACMDMDSVLGVMQIMARMMSDVLRSEDPEKIRRIGAWAWGLLGKCREIGELSTEEVGDIRDIGKRAVKILQKIREADDSQKADTEEQPDSSDNGEYEQPEDAAPEMEVEGEKDGEVDQEVQPEPKAGGDDDADMPDATDEAAELEKAKARLQAQVQYSSDSEPATDEENVAKQTRALLDMIIMVVGEYFGQRDLLDSREVWASPV
ncbi:uncharacterized protein N7483_000234 [Penicillium malachiteum]|uniref:uncharacterized protein n=1 Tax=Penicillium malachiteum TaxID=1324776 RepID=UPI0025481DC6|nr:uncharacterized protein N7483_000234 [Penicillium malachiteum]KAJ5735109.1 hypothetical protein N7483_000234 [Penicillium malachiteum]